MFKALQHLVFIALFLMVGIVKADDRHVQVNFIDSVTDGDTFRAIILQWPPEFGIDIPVRILDIDTPELRGKCQAEKDLAIKAKAFTTARLAQANWIELTDVQRGSFFRVLAHVWVDGQSLGDALLEAGLAKPYNSSHRNTWCPEE